MTTIVDPLPDMNTTESFAVFACKRAFKSASSGKTVNAGFSKSLIQIASEHPSDEILRNNSNGSAVERPFKSSALKIAGVEQPIGGLTRSIFVPKSNGGSTSSTISPRPVQYAAPLEKNTEISLPISPLHSNNSASVAGEPHNLFAANNVVAALPLPPPNPAPCGTFLSSSIQKYCEIPVFARNKSNALMTKLLPSVGIVGSLHTSVSRVSLELFANVMESPKSITWNSDARS
mmetsp:Transcript_1853/g.6852  ORF Transcript_1853/g.6852 Transcript_1853/m.6852 type:complete len:233 (-) Transcript_1853:279-977(-)